MQSAGKYRGQWALHRDLYRAMAPVPLAIGALMVAARFGFSSPDLPAALLLPLAYCACRGGVAVGLVAAALLVGYSAWFFSSPGAPFHYDTTNLARMLVILIVAPLMATMIGILRQKADLTLGQLTSARNDLRELTWELEKNIAELAKAARRDSLTGIATRVVLLEKLDEALARLQRYQEPFTVFLIDVDGLKHINDTLGHASGDMLLQALVQRLTATLRQTDFLARFGGDEFAIIQSDQTDQREGAVALALRILKVVGQPLDLAGRSITISASIGIAMVPQDGTNAGLLLQRANFALRRVKAEGRNNFCFFEVELSEAANERLLILGDLREALTRGEFEVFYQPVFDAGTCQACSAEALVRWRHPVRGLMPPDLFIPLAEENGLMESLGEWVLGQACMDAASWPDHIKVAVNLSTVQLRNGNLVDYVSAALLESGLSPERLELEITESVLIQHVERNSAIFAQLKAVGVSIALDDFGMGYSSLSYLTMLPFDKIKIDKSFTQGLADNVGCAACVASVVTLARYLDMVVTAEGVETNQQLQLLRAAGVHQLQGYLLGRPGPVAQLDFAALDAKGRAAAAA